MTTKSTDYPKMDTTIKKACKDLRAALTKQTKKIRAVSLLLFVVDRGLATTLAHARSA